MHFVIQVYGLDTLKTHKQFENSRNSTNSNPFNNFSFAKPSKTLTTVSYWSINKRPIHRQRPNKRNSYHRRQHHRNNSHCSIITIIKSIWTIRYHRLIRRYPIRIIVRTLKWGEWMRIEQQLISPKRNEPVILFLIIYID